ncbi:uncharacterized protein LOC131325728 [Rhododendron vialii]|uniref:uncharacterized protein LOC131325728 n=1 Tax=Rhododendron vialii TaxID=182163 RepID=UPI0026604AA1|nr:uncharacterized protein LOC131325728 [Rhododendron vialii]
MDVDDHGDWLDLSEFLKKPEKTPSSMAFPASFLRYCQEKHKPRRRNETVLVNIVEDDEGLVREKTYSVWERKSQNRKITMVRIPLSLRILMKSWCFYQHHTKCTTKNFFHHIN